MNAIALSSQNSSSARLTLIWDAISDVGYFASREDLRKTYEKSLHMHSLSSSEALTFLAETLLEPRADHQRRTLLFTRANWSAHSLRSVFGLDRQARFLDLLGGVSDHADSSADLQEAIEGLSLLEVQDFCADIIVGHIGKILGIVPAKVDVNRPVTDMGMDSLTAMELRLMIEKEVGIELPLMSLASGGSVRQLASQIAARLHGVDEPAEAPDMTEFLLAKHEVAPLASSNPAA